MRALTNPRRSMSVGALSSAGRETKAQDANVRDDTAERVRKDAAYSSTSDS